MQCHHISGIVLFSRILSFLAVSLFLAVSRYFSLCLACCICVIIVCKHDWDIAELHGKVDTTVRLLCILPPSIPACAGETCLETTEEFINLEVLHCTRI